jgi:hypothetical protein
MTSFDMLANVVEAEEHFRIAQLTPEQMEHYGTGTICNTKMQGCGSGFK